MPSHENRPPIEALRIYSREEVAEVLNVSLSTVKRLLKSGQIRASQPQGMRRLFITGQALIDFLESNLVDPDKIQDDED